MNHVPTVIIAALLLAACTTEPKTTAGLGAQMPLKPAPGSVLATPLVYRAPDIDMRKYRGIYVAPATVYDGADATWGGTEAAERQRVADALTSDVRRALREHGRRLADAPSPGIVALQLQLAGITATYGIAANALKLTPVGAGMTLLKSAAGLPATLTGGITVAGKLTDAETGAVLGGFVTTESPLALDPRSLGGTEQTALLAATKSAEDFAEALDRLRKPGQY